MGKTIDLINKMPRLPRCWWPMLETKCVGDKFKTNFWQIFGDYGVSMYLWNGKYIIWKFRNCCSMKIFRDLFVNQVEKEKFRISIPFQPGNLTARRRAGGQMVISQTVISSGDSKIRWWFKKITWWWNWIKWWFHLITWWCTEITWWF